MNDTERGLMQAVVAEPADRTPRLVLADWWDEHGDRWQRLHAEFVRRQIELEQYGLRRLRVRGLLNRIDQRFSIRIGTEVKIGDRIDIQHGVGNHVRDSAGIDEHGLVVASVQPDARSASLYLVLLERDAFSVPYPQDLAQRCRDLWLDGRAYWGRNHFGPLKDATNQAGWWIGGFVERVMTPWNQWDAYCGRLVETAPLRTVRIIDSVPLLYEKFRGCYLGQGNGDHRWQRDMQWLMPAEGDFMSDVGRKLLRLEWPKIDIEVDTFAVHDPASTAPDGMVGICATTSQGVGDGRVAPSTSSMRPLLSDAARRVMQLWCTQCDGYHPEGRHTR